MTVKKVILLLILSGAMLITGLPARSMAVGIDITVAPPPYAFPAPPSVVPIPGTYVYYVPGIPEEILFYNGWWFRFYNGYWYRSRAYGGPWVYRPRAPRPLLALPPDWRHARGPAIPYRDLRGHWQAWQRNRYWATHHEWPARGGHPGREERGREGGRGENR